MTVDPPAFNGKTKRSPNWLPVAQIDQQNAGWCRPPDERRNIAIKRRTSAHRHQNQLIHCAIDWCVTCLVSITEEVEKVGR
jgi:hypothetical protein